MSKWRVSVDIDGEVYEEWRRYLLEHGIGVGGPTSGIRKLNSAMLTDAIKAKMEADK